MLDRSKDFHDLTTPANDNWRWQQTTPGEVVLLGTIFAVVYKPSQYGNYAIYQGTKRLGWASTLGYAKTIAEAKQVELAEMDAVP